ncbi:MAG: tetratricopeptide repeat protein [Deltaproteobacteria bacterium]|nr:MAG: tetratricopeptide repeat protein [Deltaproteobacteria bacterium]
MRHIVERNVMRQPTRILRYLVILCALCVAVRARADDRSEARAHYQAGVKFYAGGDYQGAIREFSAAQQLVPADLNNYNLALCYDKLGDAEPAIQYYRAFLDKQPNSDKRAEIEASINRLEAAARSAAAKKADEARRADDARRPTGPVPGPSPSPSAGPAPGPSATPPAGPVLGPSLPPAPPPPASIDDRRPPPGPAGGPTGGPIGGSTGPAGGSVGTPSSGAPVPTGDPQLDRAGSINVDEVRDQRVGAGGPAPRRGGPSVAANEPPPPPDQPLAPNAQPGGPDQPKKETPVYKKWWFWAVVAVSGYVVYELATSSSQPSRVAREVPTGKAAPQPGGLTLLRW